MGLKRVKRALLRLMTRLPALSYYCSWFTALCCCSARVCAEVRQMVILVKTNVFYEKYVVCALLIERFTVATRQLSHQQLSICLYLPFRAILVCVRRMPRSCSLRLRRQSRYLWSTWPRLPLQTAYLLVSFCDV